MSDSSDYKIKKTRNRVPKSCENCRKKKLKCDRENPCSNCVKSRSAVSCKYATIQSTLPKVNLSNEIIRLKLQVNKLERILKINNIDLSLYENVFPSLSKEDSDESVQEEMISLTEKFDSMLIKENKIMHSGTTSYLAFINNDKYISPLFEISAKKYKKLYEDFQKKQRTKASEYKQEVLSGNYLSLLSTSTDEICELHMKSDPASSMQIKLIFEIIEDINKMLPPLDVVNSLIDRFFLYVYPFLPFIDEEIFREEISYVIIPFDDGSCKLGITHLQNASIISLLLIVLRFAFLTENNKEDSENNKNTLDLLVDFKYVIGSCYVSAAKNLLMSLPSDDNIFRTITLRNIQVLLYLRLYQLYSPEMHEDNRENIFSLAMLIQMCRSFGANRDPSKFPSVFTDSRGNNIWRRIFYKLIALDVDNSYEHGCPLIISDNEFDVRLPSLTDHELSVLRNYAKVKTGSKSPDEIKHLVIEHAINKEVALEYEVSKLTREGLNAFQNFNKPTTKGKMIDIVRKMQNFVDNRIPSFWEMLQDNMELQNLEETFKVPKIRKFEIRFMLQTYLNGFHYLLFLNENKNNGNDSDYNTVNSGSANSDDGYSNSNDNVNETYYSNGPDELSARAAETSLTILKINHDYCHYMTHLDDAENKTKQHQAIKSFSANCDVFLLNRIQTSFIRPFLFLSSSFLKFIGDGHCRISSVIGKFSNTIDATVILKWLNVNIEFETSPGESEFSLLLFQYIKNIFFYNHMLRNDYYASWKISVYIKIFINYFNEYHKEKCQNYLQPQFVSALHKTSPEYSPIKSGDSSNNFAENEGYYSNSANTDELTSNMSEGSKDKDFAFMNEFMDTAVPEEQDINFENASANLDSLIFDNFDKMVDDIMNDSINRNSLIMNDSMFGHKDLRGVSYGKQEINTNSSAGFGHHIKREEDKGKEQFLQAVHSDHGVRHTHQEGSKLFTPQTNLFPRLSSNEAKDTLDPNSGSTFNEMMSQFLSNSSV